MESPEPVSRVEPPTTIIDPTRAATPKSQTPTARDLAGGAPTAAMGVKVGLRDAMRRARLSPSMPRERPAAP
jgi:hypothetical protein